MLILPRFPYMQSDMHNLFPAVGAFSAATRKGDRFILSMIRKSPHLGLPNRILSNFRRLGNEDSSCVWKPEVALKTYQHFKTILTSCIAILPWQEKFILKPKMFPENQPRQLLYLWPSSALILLSYQMLRLARKISWLPVPGWRKHYYGPAFSKHKEDQRLIHF